MIIGELNTTATQNLNRGDPSGGPATLTARSMSYDASVVDVQSNQRAYLKLQDPADGGQGSGFLLFNDGTNVMLRTLEDALETVDLWTVANPRHWVSDDVHFK